MSGSISLRGALIDDIILKNYRETIDKNSKPIILLSPKKSDEGYFVESGWATAKSDIKVPDNNSVWQIKEGKKLTPNSPVTLEWNNREGIIFSKKIELDNKYLFKITETIKNDKNKAIELFHYSQITKNTKPTTENFYILHEGLIGVVDKNLKEETYSTIEKEKKTYSGKSGWFGITDKYWMSAIIPESGKSFKGEYSYANSYKANFIISEPTIANPQKSVSNTLKIFIGAKEVYCPSVKAKLERDYKVGSNGRNYLMAILSDDNASVSIFNEQDDFVSLASANSLVSVNEGDSLKAGDLVTVVVLPRIK